MFNPGFLLSYFMGKEACASHFIIRILVASWYDVKFVLISVTRFNSIFSLLVSPTVIVKLNRVDQEVFRGQTLRGSRD